MANISDNNVILRLQLESKNFKKEIKETSKNVSTLEKNVKSLGDSLGNDMKEKQIKVVKDEIGKLKQGVKELTTEQKKQTTKTKEQEGIFKKLGANIKKRISDFNILGVSVGGFASSIVTSTRAVGGLSAGFRLLKIAIASTGIGLVVVAIASLISSFRTFQPFIDKANQAFAAMGAVIDVLKDRAVKITQAFQKLFNRDFEGAANDLKASVSGLADEMKKEGKEAANLEKQQQKLLDIRRELSIETTKQRAKIEELRDISIDENKTIKERLDATKEAIRIEDELLAKRIDAANKQIKIVKDQNALGNSTREDLQREADLINERNLLITESSRKSRKDARELITIEKQGAAERKKNSDERIKQIKAEEEIKKTALEKIEDLENALIVNDKERQIEQARTAAERTIAGLVGTKEQIKEQTKLIKEILRREIIGIEKSFLKPVESLDSTILVNLFEGVTNKEIQFLERLKGIGNKTKEELANIDKQIRIEQEKQASSSANIKLDIKPVIDQDQLKKMMKITSDKIDEAAKDDGFAEKLGDLFNPESENNKKLREGLSALQDITGSIFAADDKATEARLNNIDAQVKAADERIKRAVEGGKEGSEEVIAIEEAKIERLEKARQRSLEQQQKQAKIESALAATSSLVNAVPLVIDLFRKGGVVGGIAGIASVIASIVTLKAAVQKNTPTFHDGTSYADETGTATGGKLKSNEFMAKLEKGEMVIPKGDSARLRHLGVKHTDILKLAESTRDKGVVTLGGNLDDSQQIIETNNRIISQNEKLLRYIKNLKTEVKIDERGLSIRQMKLQSKIKKRR